MIAGDLNFYYKQVPFMGHHIHTMGLVSDGGPIRLVDEIGGKFGRIKYIPPNRNVCKCPVANRFDLVV